MIGNIVSHYRIVESLGRGAMGLVYKAEDTKLSRAVALKFLADDLSSNPVALERFRREAQSASALNHPNICTIYDIDEYEGRPFIAMEFLKGKTLKDRLHDGPFKIDELLEFSAQLASALNAAHTAAILHRDIKPANVFVTDLRQIKILDFGLAKLLSGKPEAPEASDKPTVVGNDHLTNPGSSVGTVAYMSPEQARGEELDARSDLFSLGVVLYEMATRCVAFGGNTTAIVFDAILNRSPVPAMQLNPDIPPRLEEIINKLLEKDRNRRYRSAAELEADLRGVQRDSSISQSTGAFTPIRKRSGTRIVIAAVVAGVITIAGGLLFRFLSNRTPLLTDRDVIVLADVDNQTGDGVFDGTLKQALAIQLEQSPYLNLLPDDRIRETLQLMKRPADAKITAVVAREICQREGLKAVLGGSIVTLGTNYVLTLNALNCQTGESLAREQRQATSKEQVLSTLGQAASTLRRKLGESLSSVQTKDVPFEYKVTTTSLEALRAYVEGMDLDGQGKYREAIPFLEKAVALDPNFVAAYSTLRILNANMGNDSEARKYAVKAYELRDKGSEREKLRATAAYETQVLSNLDKAAQTYDLFRRMYPKDYIAWNGLAVTHRNLGRLEDAVKEFEEVLRMRAMPLNFANLSLGYLRNGQLEEAKTTIRKALEGKREMADMHSILYEIAFIESDNDAMQRALDALKIPAINRPPASDFVFLGRLAELRKRHGDPGDRMEIFFGDATQAETNAKNALRKFRSNRETAITAAIAGDIEGIRALEEASKEFPEDTYLNLIDIPTAKAAFELHAGNAANAIQNLRQIIRFEPAQRSLLGIYIRGLAYLQTKSGPEAASEFQKILSHRGVALRSPLYPLSFVGLARAYSLVGDKVKARKSYDDFFAIWKDADADIPILVQAKAEYARLGN